MNKYLIRCISGLTYDKDKIYFINAYIPALMVYDCHKKDVEILGSFPKKVHLVGAFERIIKCDRKIYLFPCYAEDIYCYDLDKKQYYELDILSTLKNTMDKRKVLNVLEYNKKIYCICRCPIMVICIDPETDEFQIYIMPRDLLREEKATDKTFFSVDINDNRLIFPYMYNAIIEFLLEEKIYKINFLNGISNLQNDSIYEEISLICVDNQGVIWMCDISGEVFKVVNKKRIRVAMPNDFIGLYNDGYHEQPGINKMFVVGDELCFILRSSHKILKYNMSTAKFLWCDNDLAKWNDKGRNIAFLYDAQIDARSFWIYSKNNDTVYKWDNKKGFIEKIEFAVSINALFESKLEKKYLLDFFQREDDLSGYILYNQRIYECNIQEENVRFGEKIYYSLI